MELIDMLLTTDEQFEHFNDSGLSEEHHWMIDDLLEAQVKKVLEQVEAGYIPKEEHEKAIQELKQYDIRTFTAKPPSDGKEPDMVLNLEGDNFKKMIDFFFIPKDRVRELLDWIDAEGNTAYIYEGEYTYNTSCDNQLFVDLGDWITKKKELFELIGES